MRQDYPTLEAPEERRLEVGFLSPLRDADPDSPGRLFLHAARVDGVDVDVLSFHLLPAEQATMDASTFARVKWARVGSWRRYRQEIEHARLYIAALGWELTEGEQRLMDRLETFALARGRYAVTPVAQLQ